MYTYYSISFILISEAFSVSLSRETGGGGGRRGVMAVKLIKTDAHDDDGNTTNERGETRTQGGMKTTDGDNIRAVGDGEGEERERWGNRLTFIFAAGTHVHRVLTR